MYQLCRSARPIGQYTLPGYRLVFRGVADVIKDPDNSVVGALWEISDNDREQLDGYEGYPLLYDRRYHEDVMFYQMQNPMNDYEIYAPSDYYMAMILEGMQEFGIPLEQIFKSMGQDPDKHLGDDREWHI